MNNYLSPIRGGVVDTSLAKILSKSHPYIAKVCKYLNLPWGVAEYQMNDIIIHSYLEYKVDDVLYCDFNVEVVWYDYPPLLTRITLFVEEQ